MNNTTTFARPVVTILGWDEVPSTVTATSASLALVAESEGMRYYLTHCCQASATGTAGGVGCRACYKLIPEWYGGLPAQSGAIKYPLGDGVPAEGFDCDAAMTAAFSKF